MLHFSHTIELLYHSDCSLTGITPDFHIYVEELVDDWTAQHIVTLDGQFLKTVDDPDAAFLSLPKDALKPSSVRATTDLNFTGGRFRGMREPERVQDWVKPLTVQEKIQLASRLKTAPMAILGIAESVVLAEAKIDEARYLVCRRVRFACALGEIRFDAERQPYDYDTQTLYFAHLHTPEVDSGELGSISGVEWCRPMDCIAVGEIVVVVDGGDDSHKNRLHVWKIG